MTLSVNEIFKMSLGCIPGLSTVSGVYKTIQTKNNYNTCKHAANKNALASRTDLIARRFINRQLDFESEKKVLLKGYRVEQIFNLIETIPFLGNAVSFVRSIYCYRELRKKDLLENPTKLQVALELKKPSKKSENSASSVESSADILSKIEPSIPPPLIDEPEDLPKNYDPLEIVEKFKTLGDSPQYSIAYSPVSYFCKNPVSPKTKHNVEDIKKYNWKCYWTCIQTCLKSTRWLPNVKIPTLEDRLKIDKKFSEFVSDIKNNQDLAPLFKKDNKWEKVLFSHLYLAEKGIKSSIEFYDGFPKNSQNNIFPSLRKARPATFTNSAIESFSKITAKLIDHFENQQCAVVMDNGGYSYTILGIQKVKDQVILLMNDPDTSIAEESIYMITLDQTGKQIDCSLKSTNYYKNLTARNLKFDSHKWLMLFLFPQPNK